MNETVGEKSPRGNVVPLRGRAVSGPEPEVEWMPVDVTRHVTLVDLDPTGEDCAELRLGELARRFGQRDPDLQRRAWHWCDAATSKEVEEPRGALLSTGGWRVPLTVLPKLLGRRLTDELLAGVAGCTRTVLPSSGLSPALPLPGKPISVRDYVTKRWIPRRQANGQANADEDERDLRNHILPIIGDEDMRTVTRERLAAIRDTFDVRSVLKRSDPEFLSSGTGAKVFGLVAKMFADAAHPDAGRADPRDPSSPLLCVREDDPCAKIKAPIARDERMRSTLWPNEAAALLSCERVPLHWRTLYALALYTGLRQSELRALRVRDVDLENGLLAVSEKVSRRTGERGKTKTKAKARCPIEAGLRPLLASLIDGRDDLAPLVWMANEEDLAEYTRKHLLYAGADRAELHADADDETLQRFVFHDFRHTHLTWRAGRGDTAEALMGTVLHANFGMTLEYLDHAVLQSLRRHPDRLFAPLPVSLVGQARGGVSPAQTTELRKKGGDNGGTPASGGGSVDPSNGAETQTVSADTLQFPLGSPLPEERLRRSRPGQPSFVDGVLRPVQGDWTPYTIEQFRGGPGRSYAGFP